MARRARPDELGNLRYAVAVVVHGPIRHRDAVEVHIQVVDIFGSRINARLHQEFPQVREEIQRLQPRTVQKGGDDVGGSANHGNVA